MGAKLGKRRRVISFDETHVMLNQARENGRTPADRIIVATPQEGERVDNEVSCCKSDTGFTMVGGSDADGNAIPAVYIFDRTPSELHGSAPLSHIIRPSDNQVLKAGMYRTESGGMDEESMVAFLKFSVLPCFDDITADNPVFTLFDGHSSHFEMKAINLMKEHHIRPLLRPPHTSQVSQGEDVVNFKELKPAIRQMKSSLFSKRLVTSKRQAKAGAPTLTLSDAFLITKKPWEDAFSGYDELSPGRGPQNVTSL